MSYLGDCKFYRGEIVNYTPRNTDKTFIKKFKVDEILPQDDKKYYDVDYKENYWIIEIDNPKNRYLVLPTELSKA